MPDEMPYTKLTTIRAHINGTGVPEVTFLKLWTQQAVRNGNKKQDYRRKSSSKETTWGP